MKINWKPCANAAILMLIALGLITPGTTWGKPTQLTSKTILLRVDKKTSESRQVLTTDALPYLKESLDSLPEPNASIVRQILAYPSCGEHKYWWPKKKADQYDGSTTNVLLNGQIVMKGEPKGRTFCCGLTLEVFYKYAETHPGAATALAKDSARFKSLWFCRKIFSPGPLDAMTELGVGKPVKDWSQALPGDFVQIWRNDKSGHSVVFINWLRDGAGHRTGIQYWSTQIATKGIGIASEAFGSHQKQIDIDHLSVARPAL